jgi:2-phospho-L-lactate guanylyltransferase
MQPLILIPCKSFSAGKSRLSKILSPEQRDALCRDFLVNTVSLAANLVERDDIRVVSSDAAVANLATAQGVRCDGDDDINLNSALAGAVARITRESGGSGRNFLVLPIDLALASSTVVQSVLAARADIVLVPDRAELGTNLLRFRGAAVGSFKFQFGDESFSRHSAEAERLGLTVEVLRDPALGFDVDTPADYAAWTRQRCGE